MSVYDTIKKRRTIRKFTQKKIEKSDLLECLNAARLAPSGANKQPLEYVIVTKALDEVFECTKWAGYLKDGAPKEDERPPVYIVVLSNTEISTSARYDAGLSAENLILTALEKGIGCCIIKSVIKEKLIEILNIPANYEIEMVIAMGYPKQESVEAEFKDSVKYWLDEKDVLHVPKRKLKDITHEEKF